MCAETQRASALSKGLGSERFTEVCASVLVFGCGYCFDCVLRLAAASTELLFSFGQQPYVSS